MKHGTFDKLGQSCRRCMLLCTLVVIAIVVYAIFAGAIPAQLLQRLREQQTPLALFGVLLEWVALGPNPTRTWMLPCYNVLARQSAAFREAWLHWEARSNSEIESFQSAVQSQVLLDQIQQFLRPDYKMGGFLFEIGENQSCHGVPKSQDAFQ